VVTVSRVGSKYISINPLECGLDVYCSKDPSLNFIGKAAIEKIRDKGVERIIRGVKFDGDKTPACSKVWPLEVDGEFAGHISSAIYSPRFKTNVAMGMVEKAYWDVGQQVSITCEDGTTRRGEITTLPM